MLVTDDGMEGIVPTSQMLYVGPVTLSYGGFKDIPYTYMRLGFLSTFGIRGWDILSTGIFSWIHKTAHRNLPAYYICLMYVTKPNFIFTALLLVKVVTVQMFTLYL